MGGLGPGGLINGLDGDFYCVGAAVPVEGGAFVCYVGSGERIGGMASLSAAHQLHGGSLAGECAHRAYVVCCVEWVGVAIVAVVERLGAVASRCVKSSRKAVSAVGVVIDDGD